MNKGSPIIEVRNVSMRFNLATEKTDTVKEYIVKLLKRQLMFNEFYALRDVSLTVNRGEAVALIGANGSGKSTLLKCIAGVLYPTTGSIQVRGSIAPLIELGAGFDPDLTARENIYLNGAVFGHDREFMDEHFKSIVDFAELWDFIDVPVKNFSSGMVARLGFSIATEVSADILVVDEILAVGDFRFQQKCKERMADMMKGGTTLLFVSHSEEQVRELCQKAVWLQRGELMMWGSCASVVESYLAAQEIGRRSQ
ncbi:MAG: ABC transporter ATP-binding protein [Clostridia bacterium]|nr:ABC transporter ATP-binding protein [Clostridia bacterium]